MEPYPPKKSPRDSWAADKGDLIARTGVRRAEKHERDGEWSQMLTQLDRKKKDVSAAEVMTPIPLHFQYIPQTVRYSK
jgi:hypothetical protein